MAERLSAPSAPHDVVDLSEFDAAKRTGARLKLDVALESLDEQRATKLRAALSRPAQYSHETISKVLKSWDVHVAETAIKNWRKVNDIV